MKVFISSVIGGFEAEREATAKAIKSLGHDVVRAEDFGASSSSPRVACLEAVRTSELVILVMGGRYGEIQGSGKSATHEEFHEAQGRKDIIVFIQSPCDREQEQAKFVTEVQDWNSGIFTENFSGADELRDLVTRAIHRRSLSEAQGRPDGEALVAKARTMLPNNNPNRAGLNTLTVAAAFGPSQSILRPKEMDSEGSLAKEISKDLLFGEIGPFDEKGGFERRNERGAILIEQKDSKFFLDTDGSIAITLPMEDRSHMSIIVEEDVQSLIARSLAFIKAVLARIDEVERLSDFAPVAYLSVSNHSSWKTRAEQASNPNQAAVNLFGKMPSHVSLNPPARSRGTLKTQINDIAEDLTVLLRREFQR